MTLSISDKIRESDYLPFSPFLEAHFWELSSRLDRITDFNQILWNVAPLKMPKMATVMIFSETFPIFRD